MKWLLLPFLLLFASCAGHAREPQVPAALRAELAKTWPHNRTIHLVFHGHSVPAGYHRTPEVKPFDSYPLMALGKIQKAHPHAVINSIVTAIGGEDSVKGAARFEKDVLTLRPDIVFIDYALNDRRVPVEDVEKAWRSMARAAKKKGVPVVFLTPTGSRGAQIDSPDEPLEIRAAIIRKVAAEEGVLLADVWAAWKAELKRGVKQDRLLAQANHPNRKGHEIAAKVIADLF
ncbi:SGNH/GDSL hydrolase family protein [Luteolibacter flavescens]|uniref:SGNH/GDSL hydrolase family protein n=1 Tax=Luteolibacter flavescens TaxID=1859460 RepID=A0ABT3FKP8_9BACT|nr:SGNH/GDSL hydrolase family protein [Luteolibacter flavescens]MCW1884131.1 SGNH/GDSL hydrolase family protein [Luteolibacter flavescens]